MNMSRLLVAAVIGVILALGIYFSTTLRNRGGDTEPPTDTGGEVVAPVVPASQSVNVAGFNITLSPDPAQMAILKSEQATAQIPRQAEQTQVVEVATATPVPQVEPDPTNTPVPAPATNTPVPAQPVGECGFIQTRAHTVVPGDTLWGLTRQYGTSVALLSEYGIAQDHIVVGNVLNVPVSTGCNCSTGRTHIVEEGQNVFRLAIQYSTTKETLQSLNGLDANFFIRAGQVLCIP